MSYSHASYLLLLDAAFASQQKDAEQKLANTNDPVYLLLALDCFASLCCDANNALGNIRQNASLSYAVIACFDLSRVEGEWLRQALPHQLS